MPGTDPVRIAASPLRDRNCAADRRGPALLAIRQVGRVQQFGEYLRKPVSPAELHAALHATARVSRA